MPPAFPVPRFLVPIAAAIVLPGQAAVAQDVPAPEAWSVSADEVRGTVRIGRTATDGTTRFIGACGRQGGARLAGVFLRYGGAELQQVDGASERVLFELRGEEWKDAFAVQLRYSAQSRSWTIVNSLAPVFLDSFARGRDLVVVNSQRRPVFTFDLTGSGNAAKTIRAVCGNQAGSSSTSSLAPR